MIALSPEAEDQIDDLLAHYENLGRVEATRNLLAALQNALEKSENAVTDALPAPRPYPELSTFDLKWIKEGGYWFAYSQTKPPIIAAVFYEASNIPGRLRLSRAFY